MYMVSEFPSWQTSRKSLLLNQAEVHVWRVSLVRSTPEVESFLDVLSSDERHRATRFHFGRDRTRFIVAHGILRTVLSYYLGLKPSQVRFSYGAYGKPALANDLGGDALHFNLSHSHELALIAIAREQELGIDIEYIRDFPDEKIAERFFSGNELLKLQTLGPSLRRQRFFEYWVRKEAYIKARGAGLNLPLNQFDVSLGAVEPTDSLYPGKSSEETSGWFLRDLDVDPGYVSAIALREKHWQLYRWSS
jgi:4'-phosphopantetheinyl transferase